MLLLLMQMNLHFDQQHLLNDWQRDLKLALHLVFSFLTYLQDFKKVWTQFARDHFFPYLNEKKECKKLEDDK